MTRNNAHVMLDWRGGAIFEIKMAELSEVDTTVLTPTDVSNAFSVTLDSSRSRSNNSREGLDVTRDELEKRQLLHTIQLLKLELSQKQLVIDTTHNEQASQIEELKEQLADAAHEKKLLSLRHQSLTHGYEQELKRAREKLTEERARLSREAVAHRDTEAITACIKHDVEAVLTTQPFLTEAQYKDLKSADLASLPVEDFVQLKIHDLIKSYQKKPKELQRMVDQLHQQIRDRDKELAEMHENLEQEVERVRKLEGECSSLSHQLKVVKMQVLEGNYKVDNFDSVKRERDALREGLGEMQTTVEGLKNRDRLTVEELDKLTKELSATQQSEALLQHDKEYLSRQVSELSHRVSLAQELLEGARGELDSVKRAKEDLHQELIKSREEKHVECDRRLECELEGLRARTAGEMEQLRTQTREMYTRENKVLCEARDAAIAERDRARTAEREVCQKYEVLLREYHSLHGSADKHTSELQAELQVARFEKERVALVHQETLKDLRHLQLEQEKQQRKVEVLSEELWSARSERELQVKGLETQLHDTQQRLRGYEQIEKELDDIVMQSAQMEHSCDAERVLFSYGFGASVPTHSKRRLQQSVHLARRVLQLEKLNVSLQDQLKSEEARTARLSQELEEQQQLLKSSHQPQGYLITRVRQQRDELESHKALVGKLEGELETVRREKAVLIETKNQMAADLERLLNHREELQLMKVMLLGGRGTKIKHAGPRPAPHPAPSPPGTLTSSSSRSTTSSTHPTDSSQTQQPLADSLHQPRPTVFTKQFQ